VKRTFLLVLVLAVWGACALAGGGSGGVFIVTGTDGVRRIVNVPAAPGESNQVPQGTAGRREELWSVVQDAAKTHGLDPTLVDLVIRMESGYNPRAVSAKGARGVMQLMPSTASLYGVRDSFDPRENIRAGVHYLRDLVARFDSDLSLALAAYNAGPEAVAKHGGVPPYSETRHYVSSILSAYQGKSPALLSGGFGRPAKAAGRPVGIFAEDGTTLISNARRTGEARVSQRLALF
jgi:hypothetical protein